MPKLAFFEDEAAWHLKPLVYTRPAYDLRAGIMSLRHRIELDLGHDADYLMGRTQVRMLASFDGDGSPAFGLPADRPESILFINGRLLTAPNTLLGQWRGLMEDGGESPRHARKWMHGDDVVSAWCPPDCPLELVDGIPQFAEMDTVELDDVRLLRRIWELTDEIARFIDEDASALGIRGVSDEAVVSAQAILSGSHFMAVGPGAAIEPGAILVSDDGPIIVEADALVMAGAVLRGPCHVGKGAQVKMGARIARSSIGEQCRVGGEVANSILMAYTNKAHDGYVGNSYIGKWCNLGADTNTSNLRNDYGEITIYNEHLERYEESGRQFVGLIMGDHSRSGINTMFNTGTVVGVACNIFGAGYQPRHIPSFSWGGKDRLMLYRPERAFASMRAMMARRGKGLSPEEETALHTVYNARMAGAKP